ncbi:unnamed protein product, partial [Notodromas monacha]
VSPEKPKSDRLSRTKDLFADSDSDGDDLFSSARSEPTSAAKQTSGKQEKSSVLAAAGVKETSAAVGNKPIKASVVASPAASSLFDDDDEDFLFRSDPKETVSVSENMDTKDNADSIKDEEPRVAPKKKIPAGAVNIFAGMGIKLPARSKPLPASSSSSSNTSGASSPVTKSATTTSVNEVPKPASDFNVEKSVKKSVGVVEKKKEVKRLFSSSESESEKAVKNSVAEIPTFQKPTGVEEKQKPQVTKTLSSKPKKQASSKNLFSSSATDSDDDIFASARSTKQASSVKGKVVTEPIVPSADLKKVKSAPQEVKKKPEIQEVKKPAVKKVDSVPKIEKKSEQKKASAKIFDSDSESDADIF